MKKIALIAAMGLMGVGSTFAQVSPINANFNVNITLTSRCLLTVGTGTDVAFAYTSFQGLDQPSTGGAFSLQCTAGMPAPTFALDSTAVTDAATNLQYTLTLPTALAGTGAVQNYTIAGNMVSGQAGSCTNVSSTPCTNALGAGKQRTLTVTY